VGGAVGIGLLTAVAAARFDAARPHHPSPATLSAAATSSWAWGFVVGAALLVGAAVSAGLLLRGRTERPVLEAEWVRAASAPGATPSTATQTATTRLERPPAELVSLPPPCHGGALSVAIAQGHSHVIRNARKWRPPSSRGTYA
jgi:hypothetical protein